MRSVWLCLLCFLGGCQGYVQTQMQLVEQTRKGLVLLSKAQEEHQELSQQLSLLGRKRLDEAFDEDVRNCQELSPQWVIEHRRAYAVGLDALGMQQAKAAEAQRINRENLRAVDQALQRLYWLQSLQIGWMSLEEVGDDKRQLER